jgi:hypothetical protein
LVVGLAVATEHHIRLAVQVQVAQDLYRILQDGLVPMLVLHFNQVLHLMVQEQDTEILAANTHQRMDMLVAVVVAQVAQAVQLLQVVDQTETTLQAAQAEQEEVLQYQVLL